MEVSVEAKRKLQNERGLDRRGVENVKNFLIWRWEKSRLFERYFYYKGRELLDLLCHVR